MCQNRLARARGNIREIKKLISRYIDVHEAQLLRGEEIKIEDLNIENELLKFQRIEELSRLYNGLDNENARRTYYDQIEFVLKDAHERGIWFNKDRDLVDYAEKYHPNLKLYQKKISKGLKPIRDHNNVNLNSDISYKTLIWVDTNGYYRLPDERE